MKPLFIFAVYLFSLPCFAQNSELSTDLPTNFDQAVILSASAEGNGDFYFLRTGSKVQVFHCYRECRVIGEKAGYELASLEVGLKALIDSDRRSSSVGKVVRSIAKITAIGAVVGGIVTAFATGTMGEGLFVLGQGVSFDPVSGGQILGACMGGGAFGALIGGGIRAFEINTRKRCTRRFDEVLKEIAKGSGESKNSEYVRIWITGDDYVIQPRIEEMMKLSRPGARCATVLASK